MNPQGQGWIGVDLDGTLAVYPYNFPDVGPPIEKMVKRVKQWLTEGKEVRIVTARVSMCGRSSEHGTADQAFCDNQRARVERWCQEHLGQVLAVTCEKDFLMVELWDDRAVQVVSNTGYALQDLVDWASLVPQGAEPAGA